MCIHVHRLLCVGPELIITHTLYVQVKILKRPTDVDGEGSSRGTTTVEQASNEFKTLAQREAEYATARYIHIHVHVYTLYFVR